MFIHIFGFRWKPGVTEAQKSRAAEEILDFRGNIRGLIEVQVGSNVSPRGQGYSFAGLMQFTDKASAEAYSTHPAHLALLEWLVPLIAPVGLAVQVSRGTT